MLKFRPHHFLCTLGFEGKGYSPAFVEGYARIAEKLRDAPGGDDELIQVTWDTDSICAPCPNRREAACTSQERIAKLDRAHAAVLGLQGGETLRWEEAKQRIKDRMTPEKFDLACGDCSWKALGVCERALKRLRGATGLIAIALLCAAGSAQAAPAKKNSKAPASTSMVIATASATNEGAPLPSLANVKPSAAAKTLAKAWSAYRDGKFAKARALAAPIQTHPQFGDHAYAVVGRAARDEALRLADEKKWAEAAILARQAAKSFDEIRRASPYSPWYANAVEEKARAEAIQGWAAAGQKKDTAALKFFETAFQSLMLENSMHLLDIRVVGAFADACKRAPTSACKAWISRLAIFYPRGAPELSALASAMPEIANATKPNYATGKITLPYKQKDADEVAFDAAYAFVVQGDWKEGRSAFEKFLIDYPRSAQRNRVRYWLAYCHEKRGDTDLAKPLYDQVAQESPLTVHGVLATWATQKTPESRIAATTPELRGSEDFMPPVEAFRLPRAEQLIRAGALDLAAKDLGGFKARDTASTPYLMYVAGLAHQAQAHLAAFGLLTEVIARADESVYTQTGLDFVFPTPEWERVKRIAAEQGVDPILVLSLMKQESGFEREILSSSGAGGYMQLMPFTALEVESDVKRTAILDPETNIRLGTKYLKKLLTRFDGNAGLALAGYNAGPNAVARWVKEGKASQGLLEWIEQIPYKETQGYVGTIFRNYVWYKKRLEGKTIEGTQDFWPKAAK